MSQPWVGSCSPVDSRTYFDFIQNLENKYGTATTPNHDQSHDVQFCAQTLAPLERTKSWAPDDAVTHCHACRAVFGIFLRKHHCRACGRIFCDNCSRHRAKLPRDLANFPSSPDSKNWYNYLASWSNIMKLSYLYSEERVCDNCKLNVEKLWKLSPAIRILNKLRLDLQDLCVWACVSIEWRDAVRAVRSQYGNLQFKLPWFHPAVSDQEYLLRNVLYLAGHSRWMILVIKATNWANPEQVAATERMIFTKRRVSCSFVQCKALCNECFSIEEAIELLSLNITSSTVRSHVLGVIDQANDTQFECFVPFLVSEMQRECGQDRRIMRLLVSRSKDSALIRSAVFWSLRIFKSSYYKYSYEQFVLSLHKELGEKVVLDELMRSLSIVKILDKMPDAAEHTVDELHEYFALSFGKLKSEDAKENLLFDAEEEERDQVLREFENETDTESVLQPINHTLLPCSNSKVATAVVLSGIKVKSSATSPVVIPFQISGTDKYYELLYKPECLLKDQIALNVIRLMDQLLKRDLGLDMHIVTYRVLPTTDSAGLIEIIPDSETIYSIRHHHKFSLQNWILEHSRGLTVEMVRDNFVKSSAAYCVISYLLAVGDRHLDNIMVTKNGYLFHIDYGFFMGFDTKLLAPYMRITQDIVDALGGVDSQDFMRMKVYCSQIYNCLRKYTNLFASLLLPITEDRTAVDNGSFTKEHLEEQLLHRFAPSETTIEAELQLLNRLEDSYHSSTPQFCIDFWHYHSRESTLSRVFGNVSSFNIWPFSSS